MGNKAQLVAIPTTSGTGSEVTSFAVISDKKNNMKYPLADYELTPNIAIIDPQFVMSLPKSATADTGLDVLTHALEAYVSVMASDYTDGLVCSWKILEYKLNSFHCKTVCVIRRHYRYICLKCVCKHVKTCVGSC